MYIRTIAFCLATTMALAPLTARAGGDFVLHAIGSRVDPNVYGSDGCYYLGTSASPKTRLGKCTRDGHLRISQSKTRTDASACELRVWETGVFKFTWHAEFRYNQNGVCSMRWLDADTLEVRISN